MFDRIEKIEELIGQILDIEENIIFGGIPRSIFQGNKIFNDIDAFTTFENVEIFKEKIKDIHHKSETLLNECYFENHSVKFYLNFCDCNKPENTIFSKDKNYFYCKCEDGKLCTSCLSRRCNYCGEVFKQEYKIKIDFIIGKRPEQDFTNMYHDFMQNTLILKKEDGKIKLKSNIYPIENIKKDEMTFCLDTFDEKYRTKYRVDAIMRRVRDFKYRKLKLTNISKDFLDYCFKYPMPERYSFEKWKNIFNTPFTISHIPSLQEK